MKRDIDSRLENESVIFHVGCANVHPCGADRRDCSEAALGEAIAAHRPLVVEHESSRTEAGEFTSYYFVRSDGSGTKFYEKKTDVADSDCGSYCGWHRESFSAMPVAVAEGKVHVEGSAPFAASSLACTQ